MKNRKLRQIGIIISIALGLEIEAVFYYVFGINPRYIPLAAIILLWAVNSVLVGCVVDEIFRRKFHIRLC